MEIVKDLWFCSDCTLAHCNGEACEDPAKDSEIVAGLESLGPHVAANFTSDDGIKELSNCGCDCCGSHLADEMHRFALLV